MSGYELDPFLLNLDVDAGIDTVDLTDGKLHLQNIHQGTDYCNQFTVAIDSVPVDFSQFDDCIMTARSYARMATVEFEIKASDGEIDLNANGTLVFRIDAAKTADIDIPRGVERSSAPQRIMLGHDIRLYQAGEIYPLAYGEIEVVLAYTR